MADSFFLMTLPHHNHIVHTRTLLRGRLRVVLTLSAKKKVLFAPPERKVFDPILPQSPQPSLSHHKNIGENSPVLHQPESSQKKTHPQEFYKALSIVVALSEKEKIDSPPHKKAQKTKRKSSSPSLFKELFKMGLTAAVIFFITFVGFNYSSLAQISQKYLSPETFSKQQKLMEGLTKEEKAGNGLLEKASLLPLAGTQNLGKIDLPTLSIDVSPPDNRIIIPKIGKNIPIVTIPETSILEENWNQLEKDIQGALKDGVVHYPGTANPGQFGNVFITGHSSYYPWDPGRYKDVFALLHDLDVGDEYTIFFAGKKYNYKIVERKIISPKDVSVLQQPENERISTLMTCTPVGTALNRLILVAKEIDK